MIQVDMEMPNNCAECRFCSDGWCYAIPEFEKQPTETMTERRPLWCPLLPGPKPSLGEAFDALAKTTNRLRETAKRNSSNEH